MNSYFYITMRITILGGGSWGTALAVHLATKKHQIKIWEFFEQQAREMQQKRECPLLPGVPLAENIIVSSDMDYTLGGAELVLVVVPSDKVESTLEKAKTHLKSPPLILCSKGFASSNRLLSEVVHEKISNHLFFLYGPTHAEEVGRGLLSGIVLAGGAGKEKLKLEFESEKLKVELSDDIVGVQVAAALKNIVALAVGMVDGLGGGDNATAYIMTKGYAEIRQIGLAWGGKDETFHGLAGIGDIIVTCLSEHSRNFRVGRELGKGRKLAEILTEMKMVAEGVATAQMVPVLKEKFGLELPLLSSVYRIVYERKPAKELCENL